MSLLDRVEKRLGPYALPNLSLWLLVGQAMVFVGANLRATNDPRGVMGVYEQLMLDPQAVLGGEWWRLLTFPFAPAALEWPLLAIFYFYLFYLFGTTLESVWGDFRFNAYLGVGYVATVGAAFLADWIAPGSGVVTADFVYGSLFLAFARLYPDFELMLFFILPVKIKWLARLQWFFYWMTAIFGDWHSRLMAAAAIFNYLLFFGGEVLQEMRHGHRRMRHKAKTLKQPTKVVHECRVCGLTSEMAPKTPFRYCSKCEGQCCYCPEHIKNHECVRETGGG